MVDQQLDAVGAEVAVDTVEGLVEVEVVGEAGAAAADDPQAQAVVVADALGLLDLKDLLRRLGGEAQEVLLADVGSAGGGG